MESRAGIINLLLLILRICMSVCQPHNSAEIEHVAAMAGREASMTCDVQPRRLDDSLLVVLWHKNHSLVFSYDVRDESSPEKSWMNRSAFSSDVTFDLTSRPARLVLKAVAFADRGLYRCRVDFRHSRTKYFSTNLSVIVAPEIRITANNKNIDQQAIGPFKIGDSLELRCQAVNGEPPAEVQWTTSHAQSLDLDDCGHKSVTLPPRSLSWACISYLSRSHQHQVLTCEANNSRAVEVTRRSVTINMIFAPLAVAIVDKRESLEAGVSVTVTCECLGAQPAGSISWHLSPDSDLFSSTTHTVLTDTGNVTVSTLNFSPRAQDHNRTMFCRCVSPVMQSPTLEDSWLLRVLYAPEVQVRLAASLNPDLIRQGDDVYFECEVQANPPVQSLHWLHNGVVVEHNKSGGVLVTASSLVLQHLNSHMSGNYCCVAANQLGESRSAAVSLDVKYAPQCSSREPQVLGAAKHELLLVHCHMLANPGELTFSWTFNNSLETVPLARKHVHTNGSSSVLHYRPRWQTDYGTLACTAANTVSTSTRPCVFHVLAAGKPDAPVNCSLLVVSVSEVDMSCQRGFDGGAVQTFNLVVSSMDDGKVVFSRHQAEVPEWRVGNLSAGHRYTLKATSENVQGQSAAVVLFHRAQNNTQTASSVSEQDLSEITMAEMQPQPSPVSPLLAAVLGISVACVLMLVATVLVMRALCARRRNLLQHHHQQEQPQQQQQCQPQRKCVQLSQLQSDSTDSQQVKVTSRLRTPSEACASLSHQPACLSSFHQPPDDVCTTVLDTRQADTQRFNHVRPRNNHTKHHCVRLTSMPEQDDQNQASSACANIQLVNLPGPG